MSTADILTNLKDFSTTFGELLGTLIIGVVIGVIGAIRKKKLSFATNTKHAKMFSEQHSRIHEMLTELRLVARASRCLIFQFHNGGAFADGTSIKRFSVTHESNDSSISSILLESQDVLLTRYMDLVRILDETPNKILRVSSLPPSAFRSSLEINNVQYFSMSPLKCFDGLTPLGFVCCQWCSIEQLDQIEAEGVSESTLEEVIANSVSQINSHLATKAGKK
jgi:hypothetical protein